ncbi:serine/threonine-protein kinase DCLK3 isoform X1 [Rhineura floridana]|uniref:serine/threonine-protein kinase DCLK3 isoform X1 n=1 Tax=Rhineura floridana TaxID=261503 RepID=UPI002AC88904|nr:serine/threonine-protein kinase DCLK3 isoform X1 [Rhineura floridana]
MEWRGKGAGVQGGSSRMDMKNDGEPRGFYDHSLNCISSNITERRLQGTCPPIGRGSFGKPFFGTNCFSSPFINSRTGFHTIHSENSPVKPRIVTVIKPCGHTVRKITLLLNRRSVQTFEQLIADISEALGFPRWKNDRVRKLYNLKGREIRSVSDFFREGDAFIAMGKEQLTLKNLEVAIQELYPENPYASFTGTTQNWEQPQKPKNRFYEKSSKLENSLEPIAAKNCMDAIPPKLINRHEVKAQTKVRQEERVRTKKRWVRDDWNGELDVKPSRKARETEKYFNQEKCLESEAEHSLEIIVRCEKCQRERELRQKLQKERQTDFPFESRDLNLRTCQRYNTERPAKLRNCRKLSESSVEQGKITWNDAGCQSIHTTSLSRANKVSEKQKRSNDREETMERHEKHCEELEKIKIKPIESQRTIVGDAYELKKESRKCSRMNQSCWLIKGSQADAEKIPKIQGHREEVRKSKENAAGGEDKVGYGESKLTRHEREEEPKANKEVNKTCRANDVKLRHDVSSRADVEKCYEIGRTIGDGNFAVVMECHHRSTDQNYAMKIIDKSKLKGKEDMLENEILIIKSLSHPNIVSLIEVFETDAEIYLILEYVPGGDLFDAIIESVKFTECDAAVMIMDLCEALVYIHSKNIVHRDLKPENLLVQRNPDKTTTLKLADFGLAKQVTKPIFTVCGTPTYVAPEILAENGYGLEVDMWATGVILYILLCGFPPFRSHERDQEELFRIIQVGHYEFLSPYWDNISAAAKDLISRLLVVDPQKRYTAQQVLQHLWIHTAGKNSSRNLQREVTINLERHFLSQRKGEATNKDS